MLVTPRDRLEMLDHVNPRGGRCVEVGVFQGDFSEEILKRGPSALYLVDPWLNQSRDVYPDDHANMAQSEFDRIHGSVVERFKGKPVCVVRQTSYEASQGFANGYFDFAYIDAIHTFESCLCDCLSWWPKVKPGGWLCGHDYTGKYVGVRLAVDAFRRLTGAKLILMTQEPWASWGVRKPESPP